MISNCRVGVFEDSACRKSIADSIVRQNWQKAGNYGGLIAKRREFYVRVAADGYEERIEKYSLSALKFMQKRSVFRVNGFELYPKINSKVLNEVTATATRVKMVMKGDTIEYNAAAFQLAEGSMLDNLIRVLPGAELDRNGRITINGEFVSSLMINGRDFFRGDPRVALSNLPAYTVNKIAVYHKADEMQSPKGVDPSVNDPLVMDVRLKREYAKGLISNYEVGAGTSFGLNPDVKWLGRVFAMYYTPVQSFAIYANANNLNDTRTASGTGEWQTVDAGNGEITVKSAGIDYTNENKTKNLKFQTTLTAERRNIQQGIETLAESYLTEGNILERSVMNSLRETTDLKWSGNMNKQWDWGNLQLSPEAFYSHNSESSRTHSAKSNASEEFNEQSLLYERYLTDRSKRDRWGIGLNSTFSFLSPLQFANRYIILRAFGHYDRNKSVSRLTDRIVYPSESILNLNEEQCSSRPEHRYDYGVTVEPLSFSFSFSENCHNRGLLSYGYEQRFESGRRSLHDRYNDEDENIAPSATGAWMLDEANSYKTVRMDRMNKLNFTYNFSVTKKVNVQMDLNADFHNRKIVDHRNGQVHSISKSDYTLNPAMILTNPFGSKIEWRASATLRQTLPDMLQMLPVRDDSNPMVVQLGNRRLQKSSVIETGAYIGRNGMPHMRQWSFSAGYDRYDNMIAMSNTYDRFTGVTTLQPRNINGNYMVYANMVYGRSIDRNDRLSFVNSFSPEMERSVDYSSDLGLNMDKLKVNCYRISEKLTLKWQSGAYSARAQARVRWNRLISLSDVFAPFDYMDIEYGISGSAPLIWGIDLQTDLMAYCRRGYADPSMNTTDWVWNLQLSKAFGRRKEWVVKAIGFDLLQQLPTVKQVVNAQGRTESRYNSQPAYALLTLTYRLDIKPQKK